MEHFVAQDLLEDRARLRIVVHQLAIDREAAGGRLFGDVQEREQPMIRLVLDAQIVEAVAARQRVAVEEQASAGAAPRAKERGAAFAEQIAVVQLVDRVLEIEPAQQRIGRDLGGAQDVAAAVGFDFARTSAACAPADRDRPRPSRCTGRSSRSSARAWRHARHRDLAADLPWIALSCDRRSLRAGRTAIGFALVARRSLAANQAWLDRHFLPSFFLPRHWYVWIETGVRVVLAMAGLALMLGRFACRASADARAALTSAVIAAAVLAIVAERGRASRHARAPDRVAAARRRAAAAGRRVNSGWVLAPGRTGRSRVGGRTDRLRDRRGGISRARRLNEPVDRERPTIVFAGESVMFGEGLDVGRNDSGAGAARCSACQSANLAVHGYSTDQIYLRLARELPRFRQPVAVVSIFMTELFGRNLDDDRPHLGPGLVWQPARARGRGCMSLASLLVPYRRDTTVERGVRITREVLRATVQLAREHGATPLVVMPQFGVEADVQRSFESASLTIDIPLCSCRSIRIGDCVGSPPQCPRGAESLLRRSPRGCTANSQCRSGGERRVRRRASPIPLQVIEAHAARPMRHHLRPSGNACAIYHFRKHPAPHQLWPYGNYGRSSGGQILALNRRGHLTWQNWPISSATGRG